MHFVKAMTGTLVLAACAALVPSASAQTLQVLTAGSSAQFGPFAVAAYALAKSGGAKAFHYTVKASAPCPGSTCYVALNDSRSSSIPQEPGNLWVVWSTNGIWAYLSVDSTVGVRNFSAVPRSTLDLAALSALPVSATTNYTYWSDGTNDTALTSTVYSALNHKALTAANTDIRPEDALFATNRALNTLGYGTVADTRSGHSGQFLIGTSIKSFFTAADFATPVSFAIAGGADPFTGKVGPTEITLPIGAAPIIFVASTATGSTTANASNLTTANAASLFSGSGKCAASLVTGATGPVSAVLREALSGTMNTAEWSVFVPGGASQETGVNPKAAGGNPLDVNCGSGSRFRAVGTGDEVNNVASHASTVGYAFFSYESVGGGKTDRYLTYNNHDPIYSESHAYNGVLPTCPVVNGSYSCPIANGASFPNLRDGAYTAWSVYRMITDSAGQAKAAALVAKAQALVNDNIPDFVPFTPVCGVTKGAGNDPGLALYREHFVPSTITTIPDSVSITANDGGRGPTVTCSVNRQTLPSLTLGGGSEEGGDVGGGIEGPFTASNLPGLPGHTQGSTH
ncbi:hypothetical protein ACPOL_0159 [Acidisarcina polymorpha]|uniref:Uncharacterized protein n=1 Tax=Acidisarcina polymorpha TaxID=2211140 RepID=A0A2Z5FSV1_9BACT|nr:hypothetical protein [Acidisarcina polymorpha]AXC09544.1 hypothetical protein ACPOL_0159 [Acidisarcina polymorpha]